MLVSESLPLEVINHDMNMYGRDQSNYIRVTPLTILFKLDFLNKTNYLVEIIYNIFKVI